MFGRKVYTVSFFGHEHVENPMEIELRTTAVLQDIVKNNSRIDFIVGFDGDYNKLAAVAIRKIFKQFGKRRKKFILVLPYKSEEFKSGERFHYRFYDKISVYRKAEKADRSSAVQIRNRYVVDRSDLAIFCIQHESGDAYRTVQYAMEQGVKTLNVADLI